MWKPHFLWYASHLIDMLYQILHIFSHKQSRNGLYDSKQRNMRLNLNSFVSRFFAKWFECGVSAQNFTAFSILFNSHIFFSWSSPLSTNINFNFCTNFSVNLPSVNELSQMFPKLDGDLGCVTPHFRFDHLVANDGTTENPDSNDLKTPLQNAKQFVVESTFDEDDDEATLSTDHLSSQQQQQQQSSERIVSTATKLLEEVINKSTPKKQPIEPLTDTTNIAKLAPTLVQKQTSLHNSESASSVTLCDTTQPTPRRNYEYSRFISVDHRSISDTEDNVANEFDSMQKKTSTKTQSCQTLSSLGPRSPGAIVVKEKFIEFPKHVAHRTSSLGFESTENINSMAASSESMSKPTTKRSSSRPRFTTTKVDESQLGASVLKEI